MGVSGVSAKEYAAIVKRHADIPQDTFEGLAKAEAPPAPVDEYADLMQRLRDLGPMAHLVSKMMGPVMVFNFARALVRTEETPRSRGALKRAVAALEEIEGLVRGLH